MVFFSMTGLLLHVALFPSGTTHDCAIGQAGPSIWSRLRAPVLHRGGQAPDRARSSSGEQGDVPLRIDAGRAARNPIPVRREASPGCRRRTSLMDGLDDAQIDAQV